MVCRMEESATVEMSLVSTDGLQRVSATCNVKEIQVQSVEEHLEIVYIEIGSLAFDDY